MQFTNVLVPTRKADSWPRHRAKARKRQATRSRVARAAQRAIDAAANRRGW